MNTAKTPTSFAITITSIGIAMALASDAPIAQRKHEIDARRNIAYADTDNPRQRLDLYLPRDRSEDPLPVIVYIHGGGWQVGGKGNGNQVIPYVESGSYAGISIGYRLTDEASWPEQIHDCKAAIRWIRGNAEKYGLDPDRIGVFGTSAGGHLSAMLGTTAGNVEFEGALGKYQGLSSQVTCVVDFYGPTELLTMGTWHDNPGSPESKLVGGTLQETKAVAKQASPITHVRKDVAPFLIIHGTKDAVVPYTQSVSFHAALKSAGADSSLLKAEGAGHGDPFKSGEFDPQVRSFFAKHLLTAEREEAGKEQRTKAEQGGAGQPATRSESK